MEPSHIKQAIINTLTHSLTDNIAVGDFAEFESNEVKNVHAFLQITKLTPDGVNGLGQQQSRAQMSIHCLACRNVEKAAEVVIDLAAGITSILHGQLWGLTDAEPPQNIDADEGMYQTGRDGYDGWEVTFDQLFYLTDSIYIVETARGALNVAFNPDDENNVNEYHKL